MAEGLLIMFFFFHHIGANYFFFVDTYGGEKWGLNAAKLKSLYCRIRIKEISEHELKYLQKCNLLAPLAKCDSWLYLELHKVKTLIFYASYNGQILGKD